MSKAKFPEKKKIENRSCQALSVPLLKGYTRRKKLSKIRGGTSSWNRDGGNLGGASPDRGKRLFDLGSVRAGENSGSLTRKTVRVENSGQKKTFQSTKRRAVTSCATPKMEG